MIYYQLLLLTLYSPSEQPTRNIPWDRTCEPARVS